MLEWSSSLLLLEKGTICIKEAHPCTKDGVKMMEFHVDAAKELSELIKLEAKKYDGNLSVRKLPNDYPLMCIGQDKALFHKNQLGQKTWIISNGRKCINPKSDGDAIMARAFNIQVFGFSMKNKDIDWERVNQQ